MDPGETAATYDDEAEGTGWLAPEVAFGMTYTYVQPGQSILDIGIGTGLGSVLFQKAGLEVYGMDISPQMLDRLLPLCRQANFRLILATAEPPSEELLRFYPRDGNRFVFIFECNESLSTSTLISFKTLF